MTKKPVTYDYLHEILEYDPLTGELRNKIDRRKARAGFVHTAKNTNGRIVISLNGKLHLAHRIIWFMQTGAWPDVEIDHKDTDHTNNRWDNLREATESQNRANRKVWGNKSTGIKGVSKVGNRFKAYIRVAGELIHLGYHDTLDDASAAYLEAASYVHGDFARG